MVAYLKKGRDAVKSSTSLAGRLMPWWRTFVLLIALPAFISLPLRLRLPETPRFLVRHQRLVEAQQVLQQVAKTNGVNLPGLELANTPEVTTKPGLTALLSSTLATTTILLWLTWFFIACATDIIHWFPMICKTQGLPDAVMHPWMVGLSIFELVAPLTVALTINKVGATNSGPVVIYTGLSLLTLLGLMAMLQQQFPVDGWFPVGILMAFLIISAWVYLYIATPEAYDTYIRATGFGVALGWNRVGVAVGPLVVGRLVSTPWAAVLFCTVCMAVVFGSTLTLHRLRSCRRQSRLLEAD